MFYIYVNLLVYLYSDDFVLFLISLIKSGLYLRVKDYKYNIPSSKITIWYVLEIDRLVIVTFYLEYTIAKTGKSVRPHAKRTFNKAYLELKLFFRACTIYQWHLNTIGMTNFIILHGNIWILFDFRDLHMEIRP